MPPPKDLPGFYFDEEKNRYFPIRGPVPGSKRPPASSSSCTSLRRGADDRRPSDNKVPRFSRAGGAKRLKSVDLLRTRELTGGVRIVSGKRTRTFKQEYEKLQASTPLVWKFPKASPTDSALEQVRCAIQTPAGLKLTDLLTTGAMNGSISLYQVGTVTEHYGYGFECKAEPAWQPINMSKSWKDCAPTNIWCLAGSLSNHPSNISCIKKINKDFSNSDADTFLCHQELVTTLGSGVSGGSVHILNLHEPLDTSLGIFDLNRRISTIASFDCTVWTVESSRHGTDAVVGTNLGAALINLETRKVSWVCRTKSDIFAQQFDHSGNIVLCGLRNGAVIQVDIRQKPHGSFQHQDRPLRMQNSRRPIHGLQHDKDARIAARGIHQSQTKLNVPDACFMPSTVCSLALLRSDEKYFIGSSMDGSINLFDRRLLHRGAVQSYTGHQNSHTRLQLGVNPSETLVMSGGEDGFVRIWSIKSSEMIFEENVSNSIVTTICWPESGNNLYGKLASIRRPKFFSEGFYETSCSWGAWLGSREGLFFMHGT